MACLADVVKLTGEASSMVLQLKTLPYGATESDSWRRWLKVDCISLMIA